VTETGKGVIPRKAMTLIMLREQGATGFEVFLLKRHGHVSLSDLADNTTRLVLQDGRWLPYAKTGG
jgi:hypothetical protein